MALIWTGRRSTWAGGRRGVGKGWTRRCGGSRRTAVICTRRGSARANRGREVALAAKDGDYRIVAAVIGQLVDEKALTWADCQREVVKAIEVGDDRAVVAVLRHC
uniref:Uncharacterized protein n=1 Tax=Oryza meridionalis TaxID=40149 RepID=A0A0E0EAR5_9ORYZ